MGALYEIYEDSLNLQWTVSAFFSIFTPILMYGIARSRGDNAYYSGEARTWYDDEYDWNDAYQPDLYTAAPEPEEEEARSLDYGPDHAWWWWYAPAGDEGKEVILQWVYVWLLACYIFVTLYGTVVLHHGTVRDLKCLRMVTAYLCNNSFVICMIFAGLDVIDDNPKYGWYAQVPVVLFFTSIFWVIHGLYFTYALKSRASYEVVAEREVVAKIEDSQYAPYEIEDRPYIVL